MTKTLTKIMSIANYNILSAVGEVIGGTRGNVVLGKIIVVVSVFGFNMKP